MDKHEFTEVAALLPGLTRLSDEQAVWLGKTFISGLPLKIQKAILEPEGWQKRESVVVKPAAAENYLRAKALIGNDLDISSADKLLLSAYAVCDLNEADFFTARQVTEMLKEAGSMVGNVTQALSGITQRGWVEATKTGTSAQSQKQYSLTPNGQNRLQILLASPHAMGTLPFPPAVVA